MNKFTLIERKTYKGWTTVIFQDSDGKYIGGVDGAMSDKLDTLDAARNAAIEIVDLLSESVQ